MNIHLHIERLVLDGYSTAKPQDVEATLTAELSRLLSMGELPGLLQRGGAVPTLRGEMLPGSKPAGLGERIGQGVYRCLTKV